MRLHSIQKGLGPKSTQRTASEVSDVITRLERALVERGIPERQIRSAIATACGATPQSVFHWFNGRTKMPRADYLAILALHFQIDLVWLILGDEWDERR